MTWLGSRRRYAQERSRRLIGTACVVVAIAAGGCTAPRPPEMSAACRSLLDRAHPGLADAVTLVPWSAEGATIWVGRDPAATAVVECSAMVTPARSSLEVEVNGRRAASGGQELSARGSDVVQVAWFDGLVARDHRVAVWRNDRRVGSAKVPPLRARSGGCPDVRGDAVRTVGCGWIDVLEWRLPPSARIEVSAPIDGVVTGPDGGALPFWRFGVSSSPEGLVLRFGVGTLEPGRHRVEIHGEPALVTAFEVR